MASALRGLGAPGARAFVHGHGGGRKDAVYHCREEAAGHQFLGRIFQTNTHFGQSRDRALRGPWGQKFPTVAAPWRRAWDRVIPFFAFPPAVRRVICTTNSIESVNARLRKIIKTRGHFPSDDAASKLIWLALRNITAARRQLS